MLKFKENAEEKLTLFETSENKLEDLKFEYKKVVGCYIFNCPIEIKPYKSENCDIKSLGGKYGKKEHLGIV